LKNACQANAGMKNRRSSSRSNPRRPSQSTKNRASGEFFNGIQDFRDMAQFNGMALMVRQEKLARSNR